MKKTTLTISSHDVFGTGTHPSTNLSLQWLAHLKEQGFKPHHALDIGCGTGILSISTALLFRIPVFATDTDAQAVLATQKNAHNNNVADLIHPFRANTYAHKAIAAHGPVDLILFNILFQPATSNAQHTSNYLHPSGFAIISGILQWQSPALIEAHQTVGLKLAGSMQHELWETHLFHKPI
jgi:ribosomal protein L11 methyltransferase